METLEKSLSHVVHEFDHEKLKLGDKSRVENESAMTEITKLQRIVALKSKEMKKVKRLAKNILDQRTEVERFFLEALEHVKKEIVANRQVIVFKESSFVCLVSFRGSLSAHHSL